MLLATEEFLTRGNDGSMFINKATQRQRAFQPVFSANCWELRDCTFNCSINFIYIFVYSKLLSNFGWKTHLHEINLQLIFNASPPSDNSNLENCLISHCMQIILQIFSIFFLLLKHLFIHFWQFREQERTYLLLIDRQINLRPINLQLIRLLIRVISKIVYSSTPRRLFYRFS